MHAFYDDNPCLFLSERVVHLDRPRISPELPVFNVFVKTIYFQLLCPKSSGDFLLTAVFHLD